VTGRDSHASQRSDLVRQALAASGTGESTTPACLDDDTIAGLAEGALDAIALATAVPHLATCRRCRSAVASVARALADPAVSREIARVDRARTRGLWWIALPSAAAAVLLVALAVPRWTRDETHRAPPTPLAQVPTPLTPLGVVAKATQLRWAGVSAADRYRVTLFDAGGRALYETQVSDTTVALPDSTVLAPGQLYLWRVEARVGWNRWSASELVRFSIARGPPQ
jgi:hypothetical protein